MDKTELQAILADALKPISEKIIALEARHATPPAAPTPTPPPALVASTPATAPAPVQAPANLISLSQAGLDAKIQAGVISAIAKAGITPGGAPAPAPAVPPVAPPVKGFMDIVKEVALERKFSMGQAMQFCVHNFTDKYREYREQTLQVRSI